jgi:hypothetical protein
MLLDMLERMVAARQSYASLGFKEVTPGFGVVEASLRRGARCWGVGLERRRSSTMTKRKDLKRLVRYRMQKTGESYTAARSQLIRRKTARTVLRVAASPSTDYAELAGMSDAAVRAKTGRTWQQWVELLDRMQAQAMKHRDVARHLLDVHEVPDWWSQMVTVGYERIRGLRAIGQRRDGAWEANKSKTYRVPIARLFRAFEDPRTRKRWLPGVACKVRTSTKEKSMRFTWPDGTALQVYFVAKGGKSQVALQHTKLASADDAGKMKAFRADRLAALGELLRA